MHLYDVIWKNVFVEKIAAKHSVTTDEVEDVLFRNPHVRLAEKEEYEVRIFTRPMDKQQRGDTLSSSSFGSAHSGLTNFGSRNDRAERDYYHDQKKN